MTYYSKKKIPSTGVKIIKRTMLKYTTEFATKVIVAPLNNVAHASIPHQRNMGALTIHKPNPMNTSHEECQQNPILKKAGFQHPSIVYTTCEDKGCENKQCDEVCQQPSKVIAIGHGTHDPRPPGKLLSEKDLNGQDRLQYARFYNPEERPQVSQPDKTLDLEKTQQLNSNKEMLDSIHIYKKYME